MNDDYISRSAGIIALAHRKCGNDEYDIAVQDCIETLKHIPAADVKPVVLCKDCEWWEKQKDSAQGRCALMGMYPTGGWFCANGKREGPK